MFSKIKNRFLTHINSYDFPAEQQRTLDIVKLSHTHRVVNISEELARSVFDNDTYIDLSKIIAILHDIGRWEQMKMHCSFSDTISDHGDIGKEIVEKTGILEDLDERYKEIVLISIKEHNKKYSEGFDSLTQIFVDIIKDADRIDNFFIEIENYGVTADPSKIVALPFVKENRLTASIFNSIMNGNLADLKDRETVIDFKISKMAWCFDLKLYKSFEIIQKEQYITSMFNDIKNPDESMLLAYEKIKAFIDYKIQGGQYARY